MSETNDKNKAITVRINESMENDLNFVSEKLLNVKKGTAIRNYLTLSELVAVSNDGSIKGYNNRLMVILKQETLQLILSKANSDLQLNIGDDMALYINDVCRLKGNDSLIYKLNLCNRLGWFIYTLDSEKNVQISLEFGPEDYTKAFFYRLAKDKKMAVRFLSDKTVSDKTAKRDMEKEFGKGETAITANYSFKFMHLREED